MKNFLEENCPQSKKKCLVINNEKIIKLEDGTSAKLMIKNQEKKEIYKIKFDTCLLKNNYSMKKCDFVIYSISDSQTLLVELKSGSFKTSECIEKFKKTINFLKNQNISKCILVGKVPNEKSQKISKGLKNIKFKYYKDKKKGVEKNFECLFG